MKIRICFITIFRIDDLPLISVLTNKMINIKQLFMFSETWYLSLIWNPKLLEIDATEYNFKSFQNWSQIWFGQVQSYNWWSDFGICSIDRWEEIEIWILRRQVQKYFEFSISFSKCKLFFSIKIIGATYIWMYIYIQNILTNFSVQWIGYWWIQSSWTNEFDGHVWYNDHRMERKAEMGRCSTFHCYQISLRQNSKALFTYSVAKCS